MSTLVVNTDTPTLFGQTGNVGYSVGDSVEVVAEDTDGTLLVKRVGGLEQWIDRDCLSDSIVQEPEVADDPVNNPEHYQSGGLEALDVIEAFFSDNYLRGNVFKYLARAGKKENELQDLQKAEFYLKREILKVSLAEVSKSSPFAVPRSWDRMADIPAGVDVLDKDGDKWEACEISQEVSMFDSYSDRWGPFAEATE